MHDDGVDERGEQEGIAEVRGELRALRHGAGGDGRRSVPQVYIDDRHIGGCDDLHALERAGELDALLKA